ncbi:hypothetical protein D9757_000704 [Collybiopsis confluens]|uniref:F-box domain-containing protein n=1 Tax=Collybiopsis confluens TaxID=2823264 RepID=A0A8H5MG58_9AGAR|nr:hypothetical protein D9757_000704 [Collybiopsis confluens]
MSKHRLSSAQLPASKRTHSSLAHDLDSISFESLSEELVLHIFSYLSYQGLCISQSTSSSWSRLATDNELWKNLYLRTFGRPRLRGARGFVRRTDGQEVKSLPGRAKADQSKNWKWMFRITCNWRNGRCAVERLKTTVRAPELSKKARILLAGSLVITATSQSSASPSICLQTVTGEELTLACPTAHPEGITALVLDQSVPSTRQLRLGAFLTSGEFRIFSVNHDHPSSYCDELSYTPSRNSNRTSPVIHAAYHHPLLITLSEAFILSVYDLSSGSAVLRQTLSTFTSFPPTSLVLSTNSSSTYKLVIAYAIPVYPAHWTVGATEIIIAGPSSDSRSRHSSSYLVPESHSPMTILSTRTARALDVPQGWVDERKLRIMREQWARKVSCVADTQTDGKWVVLAPDDPRLRLSLSSSNPSAASDAPFASTSSLYSPTSLQLYRLFLPSATSVSSSSPKLTFVCTLHGQLGPVAALSLSDGRCVSFGVNGSVWVWDLESVLDGCFSRGGTEVAGPSFGDSLDPDHTANAKRTVSFDERRIVTSTDERVVERRFDI